MLKDLVIASVAALLGGLAVAAIVAVISIPQASHVTARYSWIDVPNPTGLLEYRDREKAKDYLSKLPSPSRIPSFFDI
jgi:hypothetical protein